MSFGGGTPRIPPPTPPPTLTDPEVENAKKEARKAALLRRGRASTMLTNQQDFTEPVVVKKTLLGQ